MIIISQPFQRGSVLLVLLALLLLACTSLLTAALPALERSQQQAEVNAKVLAQAKAGLIAYALTAGSRKNCSTNAPDCERPGDLPCPDASADNTPASNGSAANACGNAAGSTGQSARLGRLPWKKLGLPDLRDAHGQRLWYAVSSNYKNNNRIRALNSDTGLGTISLRNSQGSLIFDGSNPNNNFSGLVAVIIAPGQAITRQDGHPQDRSNNAASEYLDTASLGGIVEDNAGFIDGSASDGFIQGPIKDSQGRIVSNDQLVFITYDEIMPLIERRVAHEAMRELALKGFPRPASFNDSSCFTTNTSNAISPGSCKSLSSGDSCGRIPVSSSSGSALWSGSATLRGSTGNDNSWFQSNLWRELVWYALPGSCSASSGYTVASKIYNEAMVVVAGRKRGSQLRSSNADKSALANYLETTPLDSNYNDTVLAQ